MYVQFAHIRVQPASLYFVIVVTVVLRLEALIGAVTRDTYRGK